MSNKGWNVSEKVNEVCIRAACGRLAAARKCIVRFAARARRAAPVLTKVARAGPGDAGPRAAAAARPCSRARAAGRTGCRASSRLGACRAAGRPGVRASQGAARETGGQGFGAAAAPARAPAHRIAAAVALAGIWFVNKPADKPPAWPSRWRRPRPWRPSATWTGAQRWPC